ncbi:MAG: hypothetical protein PHY72_03090 [Candidatus Pacebacteria bacterium]|nr:hypothetical protein [Candidatus Paceibacterota bacterium]
MNIVEIIGKHGDAIRSYPRLRISWMDAYAGEKLDNDGLYNAEFRSYLERETDTMFKALTADLNEVPPVPVTPQLLFQIFKEMNALFPDGIRAVSADCIDTIAQIFIVRLVTGHSVDKKIIYHRAERLYNDVHEYILAEESGGYSGGMSQEDAINFASGFASACRHVMWKYAE